MAEETNTAENIVLDPEQYQMLLNLLSEYRTDIGELIGVFQTFSGLFSGNINPITIGTAIMKLINDPKKSAAVSRILPIIEKYTKPALQHDESKG